MPYIFQPALAAPHMRKANGALEKQFLVVAVQQENTSA